MKAFRILFIVLFVFAGIFSLFQFTAKKEKQLRLYWFIPDGFRAEPDLFNIYQWAQEGKLPNIKTMMENGSYGFSIPDFPSHTPTNFATLLTGAHPNVHGIADGTMHVEGYPLSIVPIGGFRSNAKKVPPVWLILEENRIEPLLLSIPGSTPPELSRGITIRGRWGGWGPDFYAVNFQDGSNALAKELSSKNSRLFFSGPKLTEVLDALSPKEFPAQIKSFSPVKETRLEAWDTAVYGYIYDSTNDSKTNYDTIAFSFDKKQVFAHLKKSEWSDWLQITLKWRTRDDLNIYTPKKTEYERKFTTIDVPTQFKMKVIRLMENGEFRIRFFYNNINESLTVPGKVAGELTKGIGPMVDFVDNYPPQLIYYPEDKDAFLEEANMSLDWHKNAVSFIKKQYKPEAILHDIYTPNQMLTSRWWLGYVDPKSKKYSDISEDERKKRWDEVLGMYKRIDDIVGEILKSADKNTLIVFSSDHGAAALNEEVLLNNLFAKEGLLFMKYDETNKAYNIDWDKTKVAFTRMTSVYINPKGLGGEWKRASGKEYEELRNKIVDLLNNLKNADGKTPIARISKWEDAENVFHLPAERIGDLVLANHAGYELTDDISPDKTIFKESLKTGYKQGILAEEEKSVWTPFLIMGQGVKKGFQLEKPIRHIDQLPTILQLLNITIPKYVQGRIVTEVLN